MLRNSTLAIQIVGKAFQGVELYRLKDKDEKAPAERAEFLAADPANRMTTRREIENYLFDPEVLAEFCRSAGGVFDRADFDAIVADIAEADLKPLQQQIFNLVNGRGSLLRWKSDLKNFIPIGGAVYNELRACIL